jgi:two-component system, chemotaxis family, sensor kinase CheA
MDELLKDFLVESAEHIESVANELVLFERDPTDARIIASIFRLVHTVKGTCGFLNLPRLARLAHATEALIGRLRDGAPATHQRVSLILTAIDRIKFILAELESSASEPRGDDADLTTALDDEIGVEHPPFGDEPQSGAPEEQEADYPAETSAASAPAAQPAGPDPQRAIRGPATIRVSVGALERIMTLVSELVLTRNQLLEITRRLAEDPIKVPLQRLSSLTSDLQDAVMRARMQPIGRLFSNLPRLVRELASDVGKKIELTTAGSDTELDRQLVELIRDPLTHMIRNCADHGIESPTERRAAGKPEAGMIQVSAAHEAGHINIVICDDGRGLDVERIRAKALTLGLAGEAELARMTNDEVCGFIFAPGFSTARQVTSISGRGVGMDVVRENIEAIGGTVALSTVVGRGTTFTLKIPLTLAIAPALIVEAAGHRFALPQHAVVEAVSTGPGSSGRLERVHGALVLRLREDVLPVIDLCALLRLAPARETLEEDQLVVMRVGSLTFGVIVDAVSDVQEIVVKPLGASLMRLPMFSGNTILGDGSVVLILDPMGLAASLGLDGSSNFSVASVQQEFTPPREATRLILFRAGSGTLKALPLSLIARIETVSGARIVTAEGIGVTQHQGRLMPLVPVGDAGYESGSEWPVLVVSVGGEPMGLLVSEIVDIVEDQLDIQIAGGSAGIVGTANIRGEPTDILDVAHYMRIARPEAFERGHARRFHVLLVDDKPFFRDMLAPVISAAGYEVSTAASGREALALIGKGAVFDAVVTDIDMPEMDGYTLAQKILDDPQRSLLPILALDAHAAPAVRHAAEAAGMRGAVGKFDRAALVEALGDMLDANAFNEHAIESRVMAGAAA